MSFDKDGLQEKIFTRWINARMTILKVINLYDDLADGVYLVNLVECLTLHEFKLKIKNPSFRTQKMENITMVLRYLRENERIKFLDIDSSNILNKEVKVVLNFVWHIIEHFSIIKPLDSFFASQKTISQGKSIKQKFLNWLKSKISITIKNLTFDCQDGIIIGALINSYNPQLCKDWKTLQGTDAIINATRFIETAEKELKIAPLIGAEELVNGKVEEKSLMVYLSQFILCELTNDIQKVEDAESKSQVINHEEINFDTLLNLRGRGIQEFGIRIGDCVKVIIDILHNPFFMAKDVTLEIKTNEAKPLTTHSTYSPEIVMCSYIPVSVGLYEIYILIPMLNFHKTFQVNVNDKCVNQIVAFGPGLEFASLDYSALFMVHTNGETGTLNFTIEGPNEAQIECKDNGDGSATVEYWPTVPGEYAVHILYKNDDIKDSPFMVEVKNRDCNLDPSKVKVYGPAMCEGRVIVGEDAEFTVDISNANQRFDPLTLNCYDRFGNATNINIINNGDCKRLYSLVPVLLETLTLWITYDNICIYGSPFKINVKEEKLSNQVKVYGRGIQFANSDEEAVFFVDCSIVNVEKRLRVIITDNNLKQIPCCVNRSSKNMKIYSVKYVPSLNVTRCFVDILYDNVAVFNKPFIVSIVHPTNGDQSLCNEQFTNQMAYQKDVADFKCSDSLPDYSDIFLDPRAESYLKLVAPPNSCYDDSLKSDLPLPPPDLTDDSGDTSFDNFQSKFPLSTVVEESEENGSIKDSIFSSECHSRASAKEDLISLSRKSSFTLAYSPTVNNLKQDVNINFDESPINTNPDFITVTKFTEPFTKPPRPDKVNVSVPYFEDEFDDVFPLPEPPLDIELNSLSMNMLKVLAISKINTAQIDMEESTILKLDYAVASYLSFEKDQENCYYSETTDYISSLCIPSSIINIKCLYKYDIMEIVILLSSDVRPKENITFNSIFTNEKIESEMLPVMHMEPILSPYEGSGCYLSDNSDSSTPIFHNMLIAPDQYKILSNSLKDVSIEMNSICSIITEKVLTIEHYFPFLKLLKEITTSEVSEISETSQWISNEERFINQSFEVEDHSLINSLSDVTKSGMCKIESSKQYLNNCCNNRIILPIDTDHDQNPCNFNRESVTDWINEKCKVTLCNKTDMMQVPFKHVSWEYDETFPEPPIDLIESLKNMSDYTNKTNLKYLETKHKMSNFNKSCDETILYYMENSEDNDGDTKVRKAISEKSYASKNIYKVPFMSLNRFKSKNDYENPSNIISMSVNKPFLETPVSYTNNINSCLLVDLKVSSQNNLERNKLPYKRKKITLKSKKSNVSGTEYFNDLFTKYDVKHRNLSLESILNDIDNSPQTLQRRLRGKRRTCSQTNSYNYLCKFDQLSNDHVPGSLISELDRINSHSNKAHVRARSESDQQKICANFQSDENAPIKLRKKEIVKDKTCDAMIKNQMSLKHSASHKDLRQCKEFNTDETLKTKNIIFSKLLAENDPKLLNIYKNNVNLISAYGEGLSTAVSGKVAEFIICTDGNGIEDISLAIEGPSESEIEINRLFNGNCKVMYNPKSPGEYLLFIQQNNLHILGSPFKIMVSEPECSNKSLSALQPNEKVYIEGQGLSEAYLNFPNQFTINTKDSGPGGLSLSIEGPSKAFIEFQDTKNGYCGVSYRVVEPGLYTCIVKFNKSHIRNSPFSINVQNNPSISTITKENKSILEKVKPTFQIGKKAFFKTEFSNINMTGISKLVAILFCPNETKKKLKVNIDRGGNLISVEFIPTIKGCHILKFLDESFENENQGDINSFSLLVEKSKVIEVTSFEREICSIKVYGKGLVKGRAGCLNIFIIEIGESVSGALNVTVDGPSKVEIKCTETDKGFRFSYIPCTPGDYIVTIKYGGEQQIKGSPFQIKVTGLTKNHKQSYSKRNIPLSIKSQSSVTESSSTFYNDSSCVTAYGSGLHIGKQNSWMDFYVDGSKTKMMSHLFVAILGPNEPCDEIRILYMEHKRFLVSYKIREKGNHNIVIKWGDNFIQGNPWTVKIDA